MDNSQKCVLHVLQQLDKSIWHRKLRARSHLAVAYYIDVLNVLRNTSWAWAGSANWFPPPAGSSDARRKTNYISLTHPGQQILLVFIKIYQKGKLTWLALSTSLKIRNSLTLLAFSRASRTGSFRIFGSTLCSPPWRTWILTIPRKPKWALTLGTSSGVAPSITCENWEGSRNPWRISRPPSLTSGIRVTTS